jgi:hypothetical protein
MDPNAMGGGMMMDPAMINSMLFGMAGGPSGLRRQGRRRVLHHLVEEQRAAHSGAIDAGKGGEGLGGNEMLKKVSAKLQDSRFAEVYFSLDQMFNSFGPFAQMMGMVDQFEPLPRWRPWACPPGATGTG